jgi:hypothetical protein
MTYSMTFLLLTLAYHNDDYKTILTSSSES